jgi:MATE family multidrug resistance protein
MASGPRTAVDFQQQQLITSPGQEREEAIAEEASLLRDNNIIPPKHVRRRESQASSKSGSGLIRRISIPGFSIPRQRTRDEESGPAQKSTEPTETTALLPDTDSDDSPQSEDPTAIDKTFEDAVVSGNIKTTWQREFKTLAAYSGPLMLTFILQTSLTLTSVFTVGHIGKNELGAVSLGSMTANITGYAVYHGLATSLDTLCAQAYGSGRKKLVGLNLQRAVFFLWAVTIPIATLWWFAAPLLQLIVPEQEIAELAGLYLRILILGAPGYACFESSKRFVQAQGKFAANMYVLFIAAPLNVLMHWLFVWVRILCLGASTCGR